MQMGYEILREEETRVAGGGRGISVAKPDYSRSCAYITFLAGDGDYVKGVVGLAKSLKKVKAAHPLVVAVLPDVPQNHRRLLLRHGCIIRDIQPLYPPQTDNTNHFARPYFIINYSKLRLWQFVEFSKMIYLDADIQVFGNIDHLFDLADGYLYAVPDSFCETPCGRCPDKVRWPEELGAKPSFYFNAGMFVFEPSLSRYDLLLEAFKATPPTSFAEQDLLNMLFRENCQPIPPLYNFLVVMRWRHPESVEFDNIKVLHYCLKEKPWRYPNEEEIEKLEREEMKMLVKKWWDIYNDESLDHKNMIVDAKSTRDEDNRQYISEVAVLHHTTNVPTAA